MPIRIALVLGPDGVRLLTAAESDRDMTERVAEYVRKNAELLLWPEDARTVMELLSEGRFAAAVRRYFEVVGSRWELEELHTTVIGDRGREHVGMRSGAGPAAPVAADQRPDQA